MTYERENIEKLHAYVPGEQPRDAKVIKLNTNENPYPPPFGVVQAVHRVSAEQLRKYPPPQATTFREVAAKVHNVAPQQIIPTNGGDELLRMVVTVFCDPGRRNPQQTQTNPTGGGGLGDTTPSYSLYPVLAEIHDTPLTTVPLNADFSLPEDIATQWNDARCRLAMIVNPHAPSGRLHPLVQLRAIAQEFRGVLLIDEAYVDFAPHSALPLVQEGSGLDNVILLRTLSKGYSLAGLRFGYGIGHAGLIAALNKARDSYNTDILAQAAAIAALEHREQAQENCERVIAERSRLSDALAALGFAVLPSSSNFILVTPPANCPEANNLQQILKKHDIFVRYFDQDRLRDKLRITIGTPDQNNALLNIIRQTLT